MPSGHRSSPSSGRQAESGSSPRLFQVPSHADAYAAEDANSKLRAQLSEITTKYNQVREELEKYKAQSRRRPSISFNQYGSSVHDLKEQVNDLQRRNDDSEDEIEQWKEHYDALQRKHSSVYEKLDREIQGLKNENIRLQSENDKLEKENRSLNTAYTGLSSTFKSTSTELPARPKERAPKEYYADAGRSRDKDKKRDKEREREREKDEKKLRERFDADRGRASGSGREKERPPTSGGNRPRRRESMSYHEPWGSSTPARAPSRRRDTPRQAQNLDPLRSPYSSASGGSAADEPEDGNYHPYAVTPGR